MHEYRSRYFATITQVEQSMPRSSPLPDKALEKIPDKAKGHLPPEALPRPPPAYNLVVDSDPDTLNGLIGTLGKADYFVFDASGVAGSVEAIYNFEPELDKLIFVNHALGISSVGSGRDYSEVVPLNNDPTVKDAWVIAIGADYQSEMNMVVVVDRLANFPIDTYVNNPFG